MEQHVASKVEAVVVHHITALQAKQLDELLIDYTDQSVLMSPERSFYGLAESRAYWQAAIAGTPPEMMAAIQPVRQDIQGEVAYVVWKAEPFIKMATDTFVIRGGKILAHTYLMVS